MAPYKHRRSSTPGKVPVEADFEEGEILVNTADGRLFLKTTSGIREIRNTVDNDNLYIKRHGDTIRGGLSYNHGTPGTTTWMFGFGWQDKHNAIGVDLHESGGLEYHAFNSDTGAWVRRIVRIGYDGFIEVDRDPTAPAHLARKAYVDLKVTKAGDSGLGFFQSGLHNLGKSSGLTIKPALTTSNFKFLENNGAFTLQAPDAGNYTMTISVWNNTGAGVMTATGFTGVSGLFNTYAGAMQRLYITAVGDERWLDIVSAP